MINADFSINKPLEKEDLELIHKNTVKILKETGIKLQSEKALQVFEDNGIKTENKRVFLDENIIQESLSQVPDSFVLNARNTEKTVKIGGESTVLGPPQGVPFIINNENQSYASFEDYKKVIKLLQVSDYFDLAGGSLFSLKNVEENLSTKQKLRAEVNYSDKPLLGLGGGDEISRKDIQMIEDVFGKDVVENNYCLLSVIGATSPLEYPQEALESLINYAGYKQPVSIYSQILTGVNGPPAIAGLLTLQNAEILTGLVLTQLINSGNPVIYSSFSAFANMNTGKISVGNHNNSRIIGASAQIADYYSLPSLTGWGALTDSEKIDGQAHRESLYNMYNSIGYGMDIILFTAGTIKNYLGFSFDKFILDLHILEMLDNYSEKIEVNEDTIARKVIEEIGSDGNFLTHPQTLKFVRENKKMLSNDLNYQQELEKMLDDYQKPE